VPLHCIYPHLQGDTLISTSGYVYTNANEYTGNMVRSGEQLVTMNVKGEVRPSIVVASLSKLANHSIGISILK
jgi:hypothetical protein